MNDTVKKATSTPARTIINRINITFTNFFIIIPPSYHYFTIFRPGLAPTGSIQKT